MKPPLAIQQLEAMCAAGCSHPNCTCGGGDRSEVFFQPRCHPGSGLDVRYEKASGVLNLTCRTCHRPVCDVAVSLI